MGLGSASAAVKENEARRLPRRPALQVAAAGPAPASPEGPLGDPDLAGDAEFSGALLGVLRDQRWENAAALGERARGAGADATVCDFLEDDVREATEALADIEAYFQESLEALARPTPAVLLERAADAGVLDRVDDLYVVLSNLRRRMVQVAAGVRRGPRFELTPP